jgi:chemotaxis response regulator CheB
MPAVAWDIGAAEELLPLDHIPARLLKEITTRP